MAAPTIIRGSEHMFSTTYEGNGGGQRVGNFVPFTDNGTIAKSVMVDHGSSSYLERTQDTVSGDDNKRKATFSCWFKPSGKRFGNETCLYGAAPSGRLFVRFDTSNRLVFRLTNSTTEYEIVTNRTFEDTSRFYHLLWQVDASQSTAANRSRVWIDGSEITSWSSAAYPAQNTDVVGLADGTVFRISSLSHSATQFFDGHIAEFNCVSGSIVDVSTFGLTDTTTGRWIPKTLTGITYGTNGFRCTFANSAGQTIGDDTSGNGNDLTLNGIGTDHITTDSPTQNHNTVDPSVNPGSDTLSEGNTKTVGGSSTYSYTVGTMRPKSGKYYAEFKVTSGGGNATQIGIAGRYSSGSTNHLGYNPTTYSYYYGGQVYLGLSTNSATNWGNSYTDNDYVGVALDLDNNKLYFAKNNTWQNSRNPLTGANAIGIIPPEETQFGGYGFAVGNFEGAGGPTVEHNYGQKAFQYTPPEGYVAMQQDNLPTTEKGTPDLVWVKNRDATLNHVWYDTTRGIHKYINSNTNGAQGTDNDGLTKFLKGGFSTEDAGYTNTSGNSFVAWKWLANGGTTSANTDGSGATQASTIQANQTAGFSIVTFTASNDSGFNTDKVAHGLSQAPEWFMFKRLDSTSSWILYHKDAYPSNQHALVLNSDAAVATFNTELNPSMFPAAPTSSVFSYVSGSSVTKGSNQVAYCWHSVEGYSKFGSYTGNANTNGPFVFLGFKPAWCMVKNISTTGTWVIWDNKRTPINPMGVGLRADTTAADTSGYDIDFLSNGFKIRDSESSVNGSGNSIIFMAFAEHPFIGDGTNPCTAR